MASPGSEWSAEQLRERTKPGGGVKTDGGEFLRGDRGLALAVAAVWLPLWWKISPAWSASVEQAHGWAVPVLAAYFWWERLGGPRADKVRNTHFARTDGPRGASTPDAAGRGWAGAAWWALLGGGGLALALATTVLEANPLWPAAQWAGYAAAVCLTVWLLVGRGGWSLAGQFWFPVFFASTALTWPTGATLRLQAALVGMNTQVAASIVSAAGFPAVVSGNVIEVATGLVGVEEACSGVRSLAAAWMAGWFFGELFGLAAARRVALVAGALTAAVAGNLIRTTTLTWLAAARGPAASAAAHEAAGYLEMIGVLAGVAALGWWLGRGGMAAAGGGATETDGSGAKASVGRGQFVAMLAAGLVAAIGPSVWYRAHEAARPGGRIQWELRRPDESWQAVTWPKATLELLRASVAEGWELNTGREQGAAALLVRWDGDVTAAVFAELHGPTVCLPAAGAAVVVSERPEIVTVAGVPVRFDVGRFSVEGRVRHVIYCQWDAWLGAAREPTKQSLVDVAGWRWQRVREGRRRGDAAYVVFVVPEAEEAAARAWIERWAPRLLARR